MRIGSYREFWPYYLSVHAKPQTRAFHIAGTVGVIALLVAAALTANIWLVVAAAAAGYGPAWVAHFMIEKNHPATFRYPLWSLISDFRMAGTWLTGGLGRELQKAGVEPRPRLPR